MGAPTLAEFTTTAGYIDQRVFTPKDLQCLRIFAFAAIANLGTASPPTFSVGADKQTVAAATSLLGKIPEDQIKAAQTKMLCLRSSNVNVGAGPSATANAKTAMAQIKFLRECDQHQIDLTESFVLASLIESLGL